MNLKPFILGLLLLLVRLHSLEVDKIDLPFLPALYVSDEAAVHTLILRRIGGVIMEGRSDGRIIEIGKKFNTFVRTLMLNSKCVVLLGLFKIVDFLHGNFEGALGLALVTALNLDKHLLFNSYLSDIILRLLEHLPNLAHNLLKLVIKSLFRTELALELRFLNLFSLLVNGLLGKLLKVGIHIDDDGPLINRLLLVSLKVEGYSVVVHSHVKAVDDSPKETLTAEFHRAEYAKSRPDLAGLTSETNNHAGLVVADLKVMLDKLLPGLNAIGIVDEAIAGFFADNGVRRKLKLGAERSVKDTPELGLNACAETLFRLIIMNIKVNFNVEFLDVSDLHSGSKLRFLLGDENARLTERKYNRLDGTTNPNSFRDKVALLVAIMELEVSVPYGNHKRMNGRVYNRKSDRVGLNEEGFGWDEHANKMAANAFFSDVVYALEKLGFELTCILLIYRNNSFAGKELPEKNSLGGFVADILVVYTLGYVFYKLFSTTLARSIVHLAVNSLRHTFKETVPSNEFLPDLVAALDEELSSEECPHERTADLFEFNMGECRQNSCVRSNHLPDTADAVTFSS